MARAFGCARVVWNDALALCQDLYKRGDRHPGGGELQKGFSYKHLEKSDNLPCRVHHYEKVSCRAGLHGPAGFFRQRDGDFSRCPVLSVGVLVFSWPIKRPRFFPLAAVAGAGETVALLSCRR
ncbi:MAG: helix-turn-helix domain-containing protein [Cyanobacteria bacterium MAG CAR2_bin_4]|nr:helix-turn-helix domain-containing protein [Cyanobacteria bacterium MAG CAR2_bin_4]